MSVAPGHGDLCSCRSPWPEARQVQAPGMMMKSKPKKRRSSVTRVAYSRAMNVLLSALSLCRRGLAGRRLSGRAMPGPCDERVCTSLAAAAACRPLRGAVAEGSIGGDGLVSAVPGARRIQRIQGVCLASVGGSTTREAGTGRAQRFAGPICPARSERHGRDDAWEMRPARKHLQAFGTPGCDAVCLAGVRWSRLKPSRFPVFWVATFLIQQVRAASIPARRRCNV